VCTCVPVPRLGLRKDQYVSTYRNDLDDIVVCVTTFVVTSDDDLLLTLSHSIRCVSTAVNAVSSTLI
jgi:hypothetical protein